MVANGLRLSTRDDAGASSVFVVPRGTAQVSRLLDIILDVCWPSSGNCFIFRRRQLEVVSSFEQEDESIQEPQVWDKTKFLVDKYLGSVQ